MKNYLCASVLAAVATFGFNVSAGNVDANAARQAANSFLKQHASGRMMAPAMSDLHLTHAEASVVGHGANAYYAFNIQGGGFIIIAGDKRVAELQRLEQGTDRYGECRASFAIEGIELCDGAVVE